MIKFNVIIVGCIHQWSGSKSRDVFVNVILELFLEELLLCHIIEKLVLTFHDQFFYDTILDNEQVISYQKRW